MERLDAALERANGQHVLAKPYVDIVTWTKGIDQKTGLPADYDPTKDIQVFWPASHDANGSHQEAVSILDRRQQLLVGIL